jgi:hypothetical protein
LEQKTGKNEDCCGLTRAQWAEYRRWAGEAVVSPAAWRRVGAKKLSGIELTATSNLFGATNSPDGVQPPTRVEVHVPIVRMGNSLNDRNVVVVEFSHPDGTIKAIHADAIIYN